MKHEADGDIEFDDFGTVPDFIEEWWTGDQRKKLDLTNGSTFNIVYDS